MAMDVAPRRFTVEEYERMADAGILPFDERTELIDGAIYVMPPSGEPHTGSINRTNATLTARFNFRAVVQPQGPVRTGDYSLPEPDLALLRFDPDYYSKRRPRPEDMLALIEVSRSRLRFDRTVKLRDYSRARVPEYWIVNIPDDCVEIYRSPNDLGYAERSVLQRGERAAFLAFPDDAIAAEELLPSG